MSTASTTTTSTPKAAIATTLPVAPGAAAATPESTLAPVPVALAVDNADGANAALSMLATVPINAVLITGGLVALLYGILGVAGSEWLTVRVLVPLVIGAIAIACFLWSKRAVAILWFR